VQRSEIFGEAVEAAPVTNPVGLVRKYLAKERTPQAGYRRQHLLGGRVKGGHYLAGGGDRVRLSRHLERDTIEAGYVEAWRHTNARRSPDRKAYRTRPLTRKAPRLAGQISLIPEIDRPVSRLHEFGGGHVPPAVALEIEHLRNRRGLSQRELAARIGVSQGQYANARRGHDPLSAFAVNRLREALCDSTDTNTAEL
jgi:Helix-turn-helix domain